MKMSKKVSELSSRDFISLVVLSTLVANKIEVALEADCELAVDDMESFLSEASIAVAVLGCAFDEAGRNIGRVADTVNHLLEGDA